MGFLGDMVGNAVDATTAGEDSVARTNLQTFLGKFGSSAGRYVDTLDPLGTFDVQFKFYPTLSLAELKQQKKPGALGKAMSSVGNSLVTAGANALDNVSGGLFSSIVNDVAGGSITKMREDFKDVHEHTFLEYLAKANLMQVGEQWQSDAVAPLVLNLGPYVQSITIPNLQVQTGKSGNSSMGDFPIVTQPGVYPDGSLQLNVVNTRASLHERIFYPWLREVSLPYWSYSSQPYTTATVTVDFSRHNDTQYVFCGCRPQSFQTIQATQSSESSNLVRQVTLMYDAMFVTSKLDNMESTGSKLTGAAAGLLGGAAKSL